jgi:hypothetical protein
MLEPVTWGLGGAVLIGMAPAAKRAYNKIVDGSSDIVQAYLKQKSQAITDKTKADSLNSMAEAKAIAKAIAASPELVQRAIERAAKEHVQEQVNLETVLALSATYMPAVGEEDPSDDWLNHFSSYAKMATSAEMRDLWARILAGKIRRPEKLSLRTLQVASVLDYETASDFQIVLDYCLETDSILKIPSFDAGVGFDRINNLDSAGLVRYSGDVSMHFDDELEVAPGVVDAEIVYNQHRIKISGIPQSTRIPVFVMTRAGVELAEIIDHKASPEARDEVLSFLVSRGIPRESIECST